MRAINLFFILLVVLVGLQAALFLFRAMTVVFDFEGLLRVAWCVKVVTYTGLLVVCYYVFRIKQTLLQHGFFNRTSILYLRITGFAGLVLTLANAVANACMETWKHYRKPLPWDEIRERLFVSLAEEVFDQSALIYLLVLSVFLLTFFSRKAIAVKLENETFI